MKVHSEWFVSTDDKDCTVHRMYANTLEDEYPMLEGH